MALLQARRLVVQPRVTERTVLYGARKVAVAVRGEEAGLAPVVVEPDDKLRCVAEEVMAVRTGVGVIDVSTLGGLELRGPDAAEFMNRFYTYGFLKQPVGRTRTVVRA